MFASGEEEGELLRFFSATSGNDLLFKCYFQTIFFCITTQINGLFKAITLFLIFCSSYKFFT